MRKASRILAIILLLFPSVAHKRTHAYEAVSNIGAGRPLSAIAGNLEREGTHAWLARLSIALFESYYSIDLPSTFEQMLVLGAIEEDYDVEGTANPSVPSSEPGVWQDQGPDPLAAGVSFSTNPIALQVQVNRTENHFSPRLTSNPTDPLDRPGVHADNQDALLWTLSSSANYCDYGDALSQGNTATGWHILGHVLHILQDLTVPAHTRNDYHAIGDVYESYVADRQAFFSFTSLVPRTDITAGDLLLAARDFTQGNFFSADTIFKDAFKGVSLPIPPHVVQGDYYFHATANHKLSYRTLASKYEMIRNGDTDVARQLSVLNNAVLAEYGAKLLSYAIEAGAGLIKIYYDQVVPAGTPPQITSPPVTTATVETLYKYDVDATGNPAPAYSLTQAPAGMTINTTTGLISWTPTAAQAGANSVSVVASNGVAPAATQSFTITVDPGMTGAPPIAVTSSASGLHRSDLWWYDSGTNTWSQKIANNTIGSPTGRRAASMVWDGTRAILFGGYAGSPRNDLWWYDSASNSWEEKIPYGTVGSPPFSEGHVAVWDGTRMIMYGGGDSAGDTWWYDPGNNSWTLKISDGAPGSPASRSAHSACWNGSSMLMFGGGGGTIKNDLWLYNPSNNTWTERSTQDAPSSPSSRYYASMVWEGMRVILYGGHNGTGPMNDLWWYTP